MLYSIRRNQPKMKKVSPAARESPERDMTAYVPKFVDPPGAPPSWRK